MITLGERGETPNRATSDRPHTIDRCGLKHEIGTLEIGTHEIGTP
jgi:hypothetical protein